MPTTSVGFDDHRDILGRDTLVRYGPTIDVNIGFDAAYQPGVSGRPDLPDRRLLAMVDTGAMASCIDSALAMELRLPVMDREDISGVHGVLAANVHLAQIHLPGLSWTVYGRFHGVHLSDGGQPHSALIGRTFLRHFTMFYDGRTGAVTISND
jgi:predicted aspartyl protease